MDINVIPADDPSRLRLNWVVYERTGFEVPNLSLFFRRGGSLGGVSSVGDGSWPRGWIFEAYDAGGSGMSALCGASRAIVPYAKDRDDLVVGDVVIVMSLTGPTVATVTGVEFPKATAETESCLYPIEYGDDDRGLWVCSAQINKNCLGKLQLDVG